MNTLALWPIRGHVQRTSWHRHRSRSRLHGFETITSRAEITAPPLRSTRDHHQLPRRTWPVSVIAWWPRALLPRLLLFFSLRGKEEKRSGEADPIRLDRWRLGGIPNQTPSSHPSAGLAKPSNQAGVSVRRAEGEHGEGPRPLLLRQGCRLQVRRPLGCCSLNSYSTLLDRSGDNSTFFLSSCRPAVDTAASR